MSKEKEILSELIDMFNNVIPDQEYLESDPDTKQDVGDIQKMIKEDALPVNEQISKLHLFNSEWFPDELDDEEQDDYRSVLDKAEALINQPESLFLVVVEKEFIRDAQVATVPEAEHDSDNWCDISGHIVLGTFSANCQDAAIDKAAIEHHLAGECLLAYPLHKNN